MKKDANYIPRKKYTIWLLLWITIWISAEAKTAMTNIYGRDYRSLNGKWEIIIDIAYDVMLIETPETYIQDYTVGFAGKNMEEIEVSVQFTGLRSAENLADILDVVAINKYFGWYDSWPTTPGKLNVEIATDQPIINKNKINIVWNN